MVETSSPKTKSLFPALRAGRVWWVGMLLVACQGGSLTGGYKAVEQSVWGLTLVADAKQALVDPNCTGESCDRYPNPAGCDRLVIDAKADSTGEACGTCYIKQGGQESSQRTCGLLGGVPVVCLADAKGTRCTLSSKELISLKSDEVGGTPVNSGDTATLCTDSDNEAAILRVQMYAIQAFVNELNPILDAAEQQARAENPSLNFDFKFEVPALSEQDKVFLKQKYEAYRQIATAPAPQTPFGRGNPDENGEESGDTSSWASRRAGFGGLGLASFDRNALTCARTVETRWGGEDNGQGDQAANRDYIKGRNDFRSCYILDHAITAAHQRVCELFKASCSPERLAAFASGLVIAYMKAQYWMNAEIDKVDGLDNTCSPLVLDLDGNGIETSWKQSVEFDFSGFGAPMKTAWIQSGDGLLARDLNGDGCVSQGAELFGENTRIGARAAEDGFDALAALDANEDGRVDRRDPAFSELLVWRDNGDALCAPSEVSSLRGLGITSLDTRSSSTEHRDAAGSLHALRASFAARGGKQGALVDVFFSTSKKRALP